MRFIPFFPLIGFFINGLWYLFFQTKKNTHHASAKTTGIIATTAIGASFVLSLFYFIKLLQLPPEARVLQDVVFSWFTVGNFQIDFAFRLDPLASLFTLVITGVGALIHIYSIGYMSHDEAPGKFFSYLNLFCFAMLVLVMGSSLPILFMGWEGVGLCSYLLIGYWYTDESKATAGKKAFIVNRVGDLGFLIGMFLIYTTFGTLDFASLEQAVQVSTASSLAILLIGLSLFVGCTGKSAQIPLFVWLPDAMAGPTPVSALIHAATMVTSGIYLISRLNFIFSLSHDVLTIIAWVGGLTAFFAATIAIAQNDIKKILAYSTISQLGYMFLACGMGAYVAGVFHVVTHAFFKALLFLGAGSVIHGMHEEQDIRKMGGLKKLMPKTHLVFWVAWLAICGVVPFSGFFSKDEILFSAFLHSKTLWVLGVLTAFMTAFYMTRLYSLTFLGKFRSPKIHVHESPPVMIIPLVVLAGLSFVGGFIGLPVIKGGHWLREWLAPVIPPEHAHHALSLEFGLMGLSLGVALLGIFAALKIYASTTEDRLEKWFGPFYKVFENKWFVDELYQMIIVKPLWGLSKMFWKIFDIQMIDAIVVGVGKLSIRTGSAFRVIQTGAIQFYILMFAFGILISIGWLLYGWIR